MDSDNSPAHAGLFDPLLAQGDLDLNPSASNPMADVGMTSDTAPKRQRIKANRNDPNFRGFGCYFSGCDFISTGKNGLSAHLGISHGLKQNERELDKIEIINNADDGSRNVNSLGATRDTLIPRTSIQAIRKLPFITSSALARARPPSSFRAIGDQSAKTTAPAKVLPPSSFTAIGESAHKTFAHSQALPSASSAAETDAARKIIPPVSRVTAKFDPTRLPVFYKCYMEGCEVLGRTPESILKHWKAEEDSMSDGNPTHIGHVFEIEKVYKFIRFEGGEVHITTHDKDPKLPTAEMLDPKNVKQYLPPLKHTNIVSIKIRSTETHGIGNTANYYGGDTDVWLCNLCCAPIGSLQAVKEHLVDAHFLKQLNHNAQKKMIHFLAANVGATGESECYTPEHDGRGCGYVGNGDILEHLMEEDGHGLDEYDLRDNETTGNVFLTVAEVTK